ncbi:MAG TPA: L-seryl-tRNA(Sec) selenium transferase [Jatrophihabitans sp.]|nr:L-seryl-tRNA(Sec) selenium transferase [Jatrophihabitans sp.]
MTDPRRVVPRTDRMLADPQLAAATRRLGPAAVKAVVVEVQQLIRTGALDPVGAVPAVLDRLPSRASTLTPVLNATGVVLHTNLGRAPLSQAAIEALCAAAGYVDVEYDRFSGARARRGRGALAALAQAVPAAEDVLVVNNGAAALLLATTVLAADRPLVVSRGELVEIGDGFRLPELIESTGVRIHEVGTTNRTSARDYVAAVAAGAGAILKVHPSNFRISGFTSACSVAELAQLTVPVIVDVGSGLLQPEPLLPDEPDVSTALSDGAAVVTASGDKLFGGPQAGLIFGRADAMQQLRRHPMARALRVDKLTLAGVEATLRGPQPPTWRYLTAPAEELRDRCQRIADALPGAEVVPSGGAVGGGGAPGVSLAGWAVSVEERLAEALRTGEPVVVGRISNGRCLLDPRCIEPADDDALIAAVRAAREEQGSR